MPRKKALLVGICYEENEATAPTLRGTHGGVLELKKVLMELYDYAEEDIVVMLDSSMVQNDYLRPTRDNILRQIDELVEGAQPGDHFFFHYSGHSGQVTNRTNSEEDGMDEVIISVDGKDLIDNELRCHLVDPLPVGSSLVAILDTCHSESLLDLKHYRCNRVFTPRISKGRRRTDIRWNANARRGAMITTSGQTCYFREADAGIRTTSIDAMTTLSTSRRRIPAESRSWPRPRPLKLDTSPVSSIIFSAERCASPIPLWECEGDCDRKHTQTADAAHVICVSACKDAQRAWEGPDGASITMELITILRDNPHPSLKNLMLRLSHQTHERCLEVHQSTRQYKKILQGIARSGVRVDSFGGDMDNFQDPQLASHKPLDMDELFAP